MQAGVKMCEPFDASNFSLSRSTDDDAMLLAVWQCQRKLSVSDRILEGKKLWWLEKTKWSAGAPKPICAVAWSMSSFTKLHRVLRS